MLVSSESVTLTMWKWNGFQQPWDSCKEPSEPRTGAACSSLRVNEQPGDETWLSPANISVHQQSDSAQLNRHLSDCIAFTRYRDRQK